MSKRNIVPHTVEIPEAIWEYAVGVTGGPRPQTLIREWMWEGMNMYKQRHTIMDGAAAAPVASPKNMDMGSIVKLRHSAVMCQWPDCGTVIEVGEEAILRTDTTGQKGYVHVDHRRRQPKSTGGSKSPFVP